MKVIALSDMHGHLPEPPKADLVLIAGDICAHGNAKRQLTWLDTRFRYWLGQVKGHVIGVAGNHDWPFYKRAEDVRKLNLPWTYLQDSGTEFEGLKIWGTPWQLEFFDWAFNLKEHELAEKYAMIPDDTDIIVAHGPPHGFGDYVVRDHENVGSPSFLAKIHEVKPKLVVYGHIHCGRGEWDYNGTTLANVSVVNEAYKMVYDPVEFEL
jgi:Icc-related predicted phosphoesterase